MKRNEKNKRKDIILFILDNINCIYFDSFSINKVMINKL